MPTPPPPVPPSEVRRRPIRARESHWAQAIAAALRRSGVRPNQISALSVVCALLGAGALLGSSVATGVVTRVLLLLLAAWCIQLRLLCNLFDGLVAVEGGLRTKTGEIFNELPDRISDVLLLGAAGYACRGTHGWEHELGWAAAAMAVVTAYVRALGGQLGAAQQFCGPMAKQHRMAVLTVACVTTSLETLLGWPPRTMTWALGVILVGSAFTAARRTVRLARELESKP